MIIVGGVLLIPLVLFKISISGFPNVYFKSASKTGLSVFPSIRTKSGAEI